MEKPTISPEIVKKVAQLSKLNLSDSEVATFAKLFTDTLKYMDMLNELDTDRVTETYQVTGLTNVFQGSETKESLRVDKALNNASERVDDYFATKGVFDRG
jgi:aspartyl-tRNA(Asn)/glutamyl-tRNA(Gln) amidotransferase subunit C